MESHKIPFCITDSLCGEAAAQVVSPQRRSPIYSVDVFFVVMVHCL